MKAKATAKMVKAIAPPPVKGSVARVKELVARTSIKGVAEAPWGKPGVVIPTQAALQGGTAGVPAVPALAAVKQVTILAKRVMDLEDEIAALEENLSAKNVILRRLTLTDIPSAMDEAGSKSITLDNGAVIKVEDFVTGNIKEANRPAAHKWLRAGGFGSLIKHVVTVAFGMGEDKKAEMLIKLLTAKKLPFDQKEAVNTNTLRAFVRERLTAGKALPPSIDYTTVPTASIIRPKEKN